MFNSSVKNVSAEEAYRLINDGDKEFIIIDVRTKEEYDNGHIPGAKLVPVQILHMKLDELGVYKDKPVLVYCASGGRSPKAVNLLLKNKFGPIYHMNHGLSDFNGNLKK